MIWANGVLCTRLDHGTSVLFRAQLVATLGGFAPKTQINRLCLIRSQGIRGDEYEIAWALFFK